MRSRRPLLNPPHAASLTCAHRRLPAFRRLGTRGSAAARSPWAPWARRQPRWPLSQSPPRLCATLSELHFAAASAALRLWPLFGTPAALIPPFLPHVSPPITLFAPLTRAAAALHAREQSGVSRACLGSVRLYITLRPGPRERAESHADMRWWSWRLPSRAAKAKGCRIYGTAVLAIGNPGGWWGRIRSIRGVAFDRRNARRPLAQRPIRIASGRNAAPD